MADTVVGEEAKAHLDSLAQRYFKVDEYPYPIQSARAIVRIAPDRVISFPRNRASYPTATCTPD